LKDFLGAFYIQPLGVYSALDLLRRAEALSLATPVELLEREWGEKKKNN